MKKKYIVVTGGAGFVGTNLIEKLLLKTEFRIISIDNYSSGSKKNHFKNFRVNYLKGNTSNIQNILNKYKTKISAVFHFGEFSRIYQSFNDFSDCLESNTIGTNEVFKFCLKNEIKLIYSATSATFGNKGNDKNLSPYAFTKAKNLEFLKNLKKWFNFKYEVIFFYNVFGPRQIRTGKMATVIGIFEDCFLNKKPLPIVRPGTQSRTFTHINDTIDICIKAWKHNKCQFYSISNKQSYSIIQVAKMFGSKIVYLKARKGERYASALTNMCLSKKVNKNFGKIGLKDYVNDFVKKAEIKAKN